jgi:hypothetical protein
MISEQSLAELKTSVLRIKDDDILVVHHPAFFPEPDREALVQILSALPGDGLAILLPEGYSLETVSKDDLRKLL